jgi:hypothetical protein
LDTNCCSFVAPARAQWPDLENHQGDSVNKKAVVLALALAGATTVAMAQQQGTPAEGKPSFADRKQHVLERMDQRIQAMQKARECLAQAQDEQAARACRSARGPHGGMGGPMEHGPAK